jgi:DNA polymerase (family 10)
MVHATAAVSTAAGRPREPVENIDVARVFLEVADLLEMQDANPFRVRAYRAAARTMETLPVPAASLAAEGKLDELPGIGADLAGKIQTILDTGTLPLVAELASKIPESVVELMKIPGLGPKRARQIYDTLGVTSLQELEVAAKAGRLRQLKGVKASLEQRILKGIADLQKTAGRWRLAEADASVQPLLKFVRTAPSLTRLELAGSYRRRLETVGDIDLLATASRPAGVAKRFAAYPGVSDVQAMGPTRCSVRLRCGLQVDLRIVPRACFGAALHYFTGSKAHNIAIRTLGVKRGLKISEYGVFRGARRIGGREEREVFGAVGLPWIPPELREARGEIEAAQEGRLPALVELGDIRGDLQMHTSYTDGKTDLEAMVAACRARGYEYMAVTDHTRAVRVAGGLTRRDFLRQFREIDRLRRRFSDITILKGAEVDILDDGSLDLDEPTLSELDLVVVAVHSQFNQSKAAMTRRIVRALRHRHVQILAHPTGRIIGKREPYPLDLSQVIKAAADHGVWLEINAQPDRLDLADTQIRMAHEAGARLVIDTDAHRAEELAFMHYGVDQARRGWCVAGDVVNTRTLTALRSLMRR